jgi:hypothetical protein
MARASAPSVSLAKFTAAVQAAVKAAVLKHPKFKMEPPRAITLSYLIRGIPVPEELLRQVTVAEAQDFANEVAARVSAGPAGRAFAIGPRPAPRGAMLALGRHVILGFPPPPDVISLER